MEPTMRPGTRVLATDILYLFFSPKVNDIIVFRDKNTKKIFVKRIKSIENREYFVEGDNKKDSLDSRKIGRIQKTDIIGKVI